MKRHLILTALVAALTSILTIAGSLWVLSTYPITFPKKVLADGTIEQAQVYLLSGLTTNHITDKKGTVLQTFCWYRNDPADTVKLLTYDRYGVSRIDVFTNPVSGGAELKVYKPNSLHPICSYVWTAIGQSSEEKDFFDGTGNKISENDFNRIRGVSRGVN